MKLSLIIPCYNEAANLPLLLDRCSSLQDSNIEVVLVDNGSTDNTPAVLQSLIPNYPHCRSVRVPFNQGYGYGILSGLRVANGDLLAWTHADMQTDPKDILRGLEIFNRHGNRDIYVKGQRIRRPFADVFFTISMSIFETVYYAHGFGILMRSPICFQGLFSNPGTIHLMIFLWIYTSFSQPAPKIYLYIAFP